MYDRDGKSEHILTKLRVLDYEYVCDRIAKFHKKILFITRVINIQILTTKYFSFQYSVTYIVMRSGTQAGQRSCPQSTRDSASVNSWNTGLLSFQLCGQSTVLTLTQSTTRLTPWQRSSRNVVSRVNRFVVVHRWRWCGCSGAWAVIDDAPSVV